MRVFKTALMVLALTLGVTDLAKAESIDKDIVDVAASAGSFKTLIAAVQAAGLVDALKGQGPLTVFAPTDAAFVSTFRAVLANNSLTEADVIAFISAGGVDTALGDGALSNILLYHVTNGRRTSTSVVAAPGYQMLNGERLTRSDLLAAGINAVDISASNGVIHVINSALLP